MGGLRAHFEQKIGIWRTSNDAKTLHGAFEKQLNCAHPGIYKFLDELSKERKFIASRVEHLCVGGSLPPKDKTYQKLASNMYQICQSYATSSRSTEDYLRYVAHHITIMISEKKKKPEADH